MKTRGLLSALVFGAFLAPSSPSLSQPASSPWPMFGHDARHTGQSLFMASQTGSLAWSYTTGDYIYSSPSIGADGTIYVGSNDYNVYAIASSSSLLWSYTSDSDYPVTSSAAVGASDNVYIGSDGTDETGHTPYFYCFDSVGSVSFSWSEGEFTHAAAVLDPDENVYICVDYRIRVIDSTGSTLWSYRTGIGTCTSPALDSDRNVYVGSTNDRLYSLASAGSLSWSYRTGDSIYSSPAIGSDGSIYVGSNDNNAYALSSGGTLTWSYTAGGSVETSPAINSSGTIYLGSLDNSIYALSPAGSLLWSHATGEDISSSPALGVDGWIYAGSSDNRLYAFSPVQSLAWSYETGSDVKSSPSIDANGRVCVGSLDNALYVFEGPPTPVPTNTSAPLETSTPTATPTPTPTRNPCFTVSTNGTSFRAGDPLTLSVSLCTPVPVACDAYLLAEPPIGIYTIYLDGTVRYGVHPVARNVPRIGAPYTWTILRGFPLPASIRGTTVIYAVICPAGELPPVSAPAELRPGLPGLITFDLQSVAVE